MGKPLNIGWKAGYKQIRDANNTLYAAECVQCHKVLKRISCQGLLTHRRVCNQRQVLLNSNWQIVNVNYNTESPEAQLNAAQASSVSQSDAQDGVSCFSPFKTCKSPEPGDSLNTSREEKNLLLFKFFLSCNISFDTVNSIHCQNLFHALDPDYQPPSTEELENIFFNLAKNQDEQKDSQEVSKVCYILTYKLDAEIFAIGLAINSRQEYLFIDTCTLAINWNTSCYLQAFCNDVVKAIQKTYNVNIQYLLYDGKYFLPCEGKVYGHTYYRLCCLSVLIDTLKTKHDPFVIRNPDDIQGMEEYYGTIEHLRTKLYMANSLAEATEHILELLENHELKLNVSISNVISKFTSPVAMASNYLNHKYNGHYFTKHDPLMEQISEFFEHTLPNEALDSFSDYANKTGEFEKLFESDDDSITFWNTAKIHHESLSEFALTILNIPATLKKMDESYAIKLKAKLAKEKDQSLKSVIFSIIYEESLLQLQNSSS